MSKTHSCQQIFGLPHSLNDPTMVKSSRKAKRIERVSRFQDWKKQSYCIMYFDTLLTIELPTYFPRRLFLSEKKTSPLVISFRSIKASRSQNIRAFSHVLLFHSQHTFQFVHIIFTILLIVHHLSRGGLTIPAFTGWEEKSSPTPSFTVMICWWFRNPANHLGCKKTCE